jgi:hypothetical protein
MAKQQSQERLCVLGNTLKNGYHFHNYENGGYYEHYAESVKNGICMVNKLNQATAGKL